MAPSGNSERTLILGLGRFGGGGQAARFLHRAGHRLRIADRCSADELAESRAALADLPGVDWALGREDPAVLDGVDRVVVNPALPPTHPLLQEARRRGIEQTQEVNLFLEAYPGEVILVTGTNGKSTTATLLHAALHRAGIPSLLGGNIGRSLLQDEADWRAGQIAVLEISSFQLERVDPGRHQVRGAVLTRMGRDHLDRHGTIEAYHAAKAVAADLALGLLVHAGDDPIAAAFPSPCRFRATYAADAPAPGQVGTRDGWIAARLTATDPEQTLLHESALAMLGAFQRENVKAAATAALLLGAPPHAVGMATALAPPLPFRLQLLAILGGVRIYDNSVSTEVESTRAALHGVPAAVHWVGGGKSKDGDYRRVAETLRPLMASAHLFGASAQPLADQLRSTVPVTVHEKLDAALDSALETARPGHALVMSPAFASFDQYTNFRARALDFHRWVKRRAESRPATAAK